MSDSISEIDLAVGKRDPDDPLRWGSLRFLGGMPNALAIRGKTLYVADGGDNAVAEVDLETGPVADSAMPDISPWPSRWAMTAHGLRAEHQGKWLGEQDDPWQAGQRP